MTILLAAVALVGATIGIPAWLHARGDRRNARRRAEEDYLRHVTGEIRLKPRSKHNPKLDV